MHAFAVVGESHDDAAICDPFVPAFLGHASQFGAQDDQSGELVAISIIGIAGLWPTILADTGVAVPVIIIGTGS